MFPNPQDALPLPPRPNLDHYKKRAKDLFQAARDPDPAALQTWAADWITNLLRLSSVASATNSVLPSESERSRLQVVIPSGVAGSRSGPAAQSRDLGLPRTDHETDHLATFARQKLSETPTLTAAQFVIARAHGFESWPKLAKHIESLARANSSVNHFERAADAIVTGDLATLAQLLRQSPDLIRAHSTRSHQATLLHYISANGIENYRQKTPRNILEIAQLLLAAGADVNAVAEIYGGSTTFALVATSIHPERAGVQNALLQLLLDHGATIDSADSPALLINLCLANGRGRAAEFLARHGAWLDLEAAAGVGRLDLVRNYFDDTGTLKTNASRTQMERGFLWACEYGKNEVADFLLQRGVSLDAQANTGQTALHWAVIGGQAETINLLLARGASLEAKNAYGGTALGQALWSATHADSTIDYTAIAALLKQKGAKP
jgi:ankyrin repeat protein